MRATRTDHAGMGMDGCESGQRDDGQGRDGTRSTCLCNKADCLQLRAGGLASKHRHAPRKLRRRASAVVPAWLQRALWSFEG